MRRGRAFLLVVVVVVVGIGAFACARASERRAPKAPIAEATASSTAGESVTPEEPEEPAALAAPEDPFAGIRGDRAVGFPGEESLLTDTLMGDVGMPALDVACLGGSDALSAPTVLDARFEEIAAEQEVSLGRVRFVRLESDPSRVPSQAMPRLCRPVMGTAVLHAPLFRQKEPPSTWLVEGAPTDVPAATRRLLERAAKAGAKAAGAPRVVVVRGKHVAVALPIVAER